MVLIPNDFDVTKNVVHETKMSSNQPSSQYSSSAVMAAANVIEEDDDSFEQDLQEILQKGSDVRLVGDDKHQQPQRRAQDNGGDDENEGLGDYDLGTTSATYLTRVPKSDIPKSTSLPAHVVHQQGNISGSGSLNTNQSNANNLRSSSPGGGGKMFSFGSSKWSTTEDSASGAPALAAVNKLGNFKEWGLNTFKCTKQMLSEKMGKASRTVDLQLGGHIEELKDTQRQYSSLLQLAKSLAQNFSRILQTQRSLGHCFLEMSERSKDLKEDFLRNAEMQQKICENGEILLGALNHFVYSVHTLCNKTMEDTMMTVRLYETARIEFDAYRSEYEQMQMAPREAQNVARLEEARLRFQLHKDKFDRLRTDVSVKFKFLEENKVTVMRKQLLVFHNGIAAYFSGNQQALSAAVSQITKPHYDSSKTPPSFLEQEAPERDTPTSPPTGASSTHSFDSRQHFTLSDDSSLSPIPSASK